MRDDLEAMSAAALKTLVETLQTNMDPALLGISSEKISEFLSHVGSSASRPQDENGNPLRWQDRIIEQEIPVGSSVLDLGCGNGLLLSRLIDMKEVRGQGVEIDSDAVLECVRRGVPVVQANLDDGLKDFFTEGEFDYVVLEETLQTLHRPVEALEAMLRVGKRGIVTFPNFGYWRVRLDLAIRGRMPRTDWLPYRWYDTPNIHLCTIQDFADWAQAAGVKILGGYVLVEGEVRELRTSDNFHADEALFVFEKVNG